MRTFLDEQNENESNIYGVIFSFCLGRLFVPFNSVRAYCLVDSLVPSVCVCRVSACVRACVRAHVCICEVCVGGWGWGGTVTLAWLGE